MSSQSHQLHEGIQFIAENTMADCSMPFLDTLGIPQPDGSLTMTVFRKPTHTDQNLQWDTHHVISAKYSKTSSLPHRDKAVSSFTRHLEQEHLQNFMNRCKYPTWAWNRIKSKIRAPNHLEVSHKGTRQSTRNSSNSNKQRGYIVVPYTKDLSKVSKLFAENMG